MAQWIHNTICADVKKALPILSFPSIQLLDIDVQSLIFNKNLQAAGMEAIACRVPSAASVSLMDLSVEAECFGSQIRISDREVPTVVGAVISSEEEGYAISIPEIGAGRTQIYIDAIEDAVKAITDRPVFAGVIGPFSLAGRLMDVNDAMLYCYDTPEMVHSVLEKVVSFLIGYCNAYKAVGANGVIMAEPLAGLLSPSLACEFSHPYVKKIIEAVQNENFAVIYHNCGNNVNLMAQDIYKIGAMGYHFGDAVQMSDMLVGAPDDALVMGNVSPTRDFLKGTPESIANATRAIMDTCCQKKNFVISSGCDIPPLSPWDNIDAFFQTVEEFYKSRSTQ